MQPAIHDPYAYAGPSAQSRAAARRDRLARFERRAVTASKPEPVKIEIRDSEPEKTSIEVVACNGQIIIVTDAKIAEARAVFERVMSVGGRVSVDAIQRAVCKHFGITRVDMLSQRRTKVLVIPRQVAMYLCKTMTFRSLPEIGRRFNGKDHTTVLWAVRKMTAMVERDDTIRAAVETIRNQLGGEIDQ